jgi:Undecaprenyl-phosphate galactose phosphotransferase WbaP
MNLSKNSYKPWLSIIIILTSDLVSIALAFFIAIWIRSALIPQLGGEVDIETLLPLLVFLLIIIPGLFAISGLYPGIGNTGIKEYREVFSLITLAFISIGFSIFVFGYTSVFSRMVFFLTWLLLGTFLPFFRITLHNRGSLIGWWGKPVVIYGDLKNVQDLISHLYSSRRMGYKPICVILDPLEYKKIVELQSPFEKKKIPCFLYSKELLNELSGQKIDTIFLVSSDSEVSAKQDSLFHELSLYFKNVIFVLRNSMLGSLDIRLLDIEGHPALIAKYNLLNPIHQNLKRIFDLVFSILSLVATLPLFIFCAIAIRLDTPGPVLFIQERMGKNGKIIKLFKFRSMVNEAELNIPEILANNPNLKKEYEIHHKIRKDPRLTRVGKLLRKTSLDELPQFINVIQGEMSIVGPRAYLPEEKEMMGEYLNIIQRVSPGLTGWWQVMGRNQVTFQRRLTLDEYYISNYSMWMDFYIIIKTIWVIFSLSGV